MSVRHTIRALRLYYKSMNLVNKAFRNAYQFWWTPFIGSGKFYPRNNKEAITLPRKYWKMLPTASRLVLLGAHPLWRDEKMHIAMNGFRFVAPSRDKSIATSLKEIFVDDVYRIQNKDFSGMTVLDIGANIGDSSIALAARGARVHAFEPLPMLQNYLRENIRLNHMDDVVFIHTVGLSDADAVIRTWVKVDGTADASALPTDKIKNDYVGRVAQDMRLVDTIPYLRSHGISKIDWVKIDCEGCEYALFANDDFINLLSPRHIVMEYHRSGDAIYSFLVQHGYSVNWPDRKSTVGYLYATKTS